MRVLLIEDDVVFAEQIIRSLAAQQYAVDHAMDGEDGWAYLQSADYDVILLDVVLPKLDGIRLCQQIRSHHYTTPVMMLTTKGESHDKVLGLDAGADDYVVKPCSPEELCARIRAILRRQTTQASPVLTWGNLHLNPVTRDVCYGHQLLALTRKEYELLELLLRSPQRVFSSSMILEHLWSFNDCPSAETVRSHIKRLRRKLRSVNSEDLIENVYGVGYRLRPLSTPEVARAAVFDLWQQFKPLILARVATLKQATTAALEGTLSDSQQTHAAALAHTLTGSLGLFYYQAGSQLTQEIEDLLRQPLTPATAIALQTLVTQLETTLSNQTVVELNDAVEFEFDQG
jgi:two-component system, OmpR family, response regulator